MSKPVYYIGSPEKCDTCGRPFGKDMYDAKIPGSSWANMCTPCFESYGSSLGLGRGQKYTKQDDNKWLKTGG